MNIPLSVLVGNDSKMPFIATLSLIEGISITDSHLMNAKAIPERMTNIRKNLFLIDRYVKDNKDIKTVMKGKYWNE